MKLTPLLLAAAVALAPVALRAADNTAADNTSVNERDKNSGAVTPADQSNDPADLKITADTRKMVVDDKSLSANAKNCKIITAKGGAVTLRGPVDSAQEKATIAKFAKEAGAKSVDNQLEVKSSH